MSPKEGSRTTLGSRSRDAQQFAEIASNFGAQTDRCCFQRTRLSARRRCQPRLSEIFSAHEASPSFHSLLHLNGVLPGAPRFAVSQQPRVAATDGTTPHLSAMQASALSMLTVRCVWLKSQAATLTQTPGSCPACASVHVDRPGHRPCARRQLCARLGLLLPECHRIQRRL
jgi:hypothetical protein